MEVLFFMFVFFIFDHEKRSVWPERFFAAVYQIYPEKPLRLFGVLALILVLRRE